MPTSEDPHVEHHIDNYWLARAAWKRIIPKWRVVPITWCQLDRDLVCLSYSHSHYNTERWIAPTNLRRLALMAPLSEIQHYVAKVIQRWRTGDGIKFELLDEVRVIVQDGDVEDNMRALLKATTEASLRENLKGSKIPLVAVATLKEVDVSVYNAILPDTRRPQLGY